MFFMRIDDNHQFSLLSSNLIENSVWSALFKCVLMMNSRSLDTFLNQHSHLKNLKQKI